MAPKGSRALKRPAAAIVDESSLAIEPATAKVCESALLASVAEPALFVAR